MGTTTCVQAATLNERCRACGFLEGVDLNVRLTVSVYPYIDNASWHSIDYQYVTCPLSRAHWTSIKHTYAIPVLHCCSI